MYVQIWSHKREVRCSFHHRWKIIWKHWNYDVIEKYIRRKWATKIWLVEKFGWFRIMHDNVYTKCHSYWLTAFNSSNLNESDSKSINTFMNSNYRITYQGKCASKATDVIYRRKETGKAAATPNNIKIMCIYMNMNVYMSLWLCVSLCSACS